MPAQTAGVNQVCSHVRLILTGSRSLKGQPKVNDLGLNRSYLDVGQ